MTSKLIHLISCLAILLFLGCKVQHLANVSTQYIDLNHEEASNQEIENLISPYRKELNKEMNTIVGTISEDLIKARPNSNLGNWFSDLLEEAAKEVFKDSKIDFTIHNYGGLRLSSIAAGEINKGTIFELMPFDNTLVNVELDKATVQQLLDKIADYGGWPISKSLEFRIQDSVAVDILINNKPLEDRIYYVAMPDYVANGGNSCYFLKDAKRENSGVYIRHVIIDKLLALKDKGQDSYIDPKARIKSTEQ